MTEYDERQKATIRLLERAVSASQATANAALETVRVLRDYLSRRSEAPSRPGGMPKDQP
jgi:hypothetical protein